MAEDPLGYMRPGEVAELFGVAVRTIDRWADAGRIPSHRTNGGHRRFPRSQIVAIQVAPYGRLS